MRYLALGDSVSIDKYTGVEGGGAVSQFAGLIGADSVQDFTHDGYTADAVAESLASVWIQPDIVTLTIGGNDLLQRPSWNVDRHSLDDPDAQAILACLGRLYDLIALYYGCPTIVNTIYDPTDNDPDLLMQLGMSESFRAVYEEVNNGIRILAHAHDFLLSDLHVLFRGHGMSAQDSWITMEIEPNHAGASAIAANWYRLLGSHERTV